VFGVMGVSLLLVCSALVKQEALAGITNGENAIDALGQYDDNYADPSPIYTKESVGDAPNKFGMTSPKDAVVDTTNHRLFVTDASNRRILVYTLNASNELPDRVPDYVLGQANFYSNTSATTSTGLNSPVGIAYDSDNDHLFVADSEVCRVLVYDTSTITSGEAAVNVLGQANFTSSSCSATQSTFKGTNGLHYDTGRDLLFVADTSSHRVMVFSGSSLSDGMNAAYVLGQPNFTTSSSDVTQAKLSSPNDIAYDSGNDRIYVADEGNNRVVVYSGSLLSTTGTDAAHVIGQSDFVSNSSASTQSGFSSPYGVAYDTSGHRLYVADYDNDRVVVFSGALLSDGMNAAYVLGQTNFTNNSSSYAGNGMYWPRNVSYDTTTDYAYVADTTNNRILVFSGSSLVNGMYAVDGLGQSDGDLSDPVFRADRNYANNYPNRLGMYWPDDVEIDTTNHRLFVEDASNDRILVYNLDANDDLVDRIPDYVLGKDNFYSRDNSKVTGTGTRVPSQLAYDAVNDRLFVADSQRHRVLVFDTSTITNGEAAAYVLGQTSLTTSTSGTTQSKIKLPWGVAYDDVRDYLFVSENGNHRITVFDVATITNGENAINVLGQTGFTVAVSGTTQANFKWPIKLAYDSSAQMLYVVGNTNHRVMVFDVSTITDGMNASYVLGQSDFVSDDTATTSTGMNDPRGVAIDTLNKRLFVGERVNNRVLVYDVSSISNGEAAVNVLGQTDFTSSTAAATQSGIDEAYGMAYDSGNGRLYVSDFGNNRVVAYEIKVITASSFSPSDGETGVSTSSDLVINFASATGKTGTGYVTIFKASDDSVVEQINTATGAVTGSGGTQITINPTLNLDNSTSYYVKVDTMAFHDDAGNNYAGISDSTTWNFTTAAVTYGGSAGYRRSRAARMLANSAAVANEGNATHSAAEESSSGGDETNDEGDTTDEEDDGGEDTEENQGNETQEGGEDSSGAGTEDDGTEEENPTGRSLTVSIAGQDVIMRDIPLRSWFADPIEQIIAQGIAEGYRDERGRLTGEFGPANPVTYAEAIKMAIETAGEDTSAVEGTPENRSAHNQWSEQYIALAERLGVSVLAAALDVNTPAPRGAVVQIFVDLLLPGARSLSPGDAGYNDVSPSHVHTAAIMLATQLGWVQGDSDADGNPTGAFRPDAPINRAEVAQILVRILTGGE